MKTEFKQQIKAMKQGNQETLDKPNPSETLTKWLVVTILI
jgi:hypothetical protein